MPELDIPRGAAVFYNALNHKRHPVAFRIAHIHTPGLSSVIHQDENILGNGGSHHRIGFSGGGDQGFGRQMFIFCQIQEVATFICKSSDDITVPPSSTCKGSGLPVVASVPKASDAVPMTADGHSLVKAEAAAVSGNAAIMVPFD